jgi:hypothetical protein
LCVWKGIVPACVGCAHVRTCSLRYTQSCSLFERESR